MGTHRGGCFVRAWPGGRRLVRTSATDDETIEIDTVNPLPKITYSFGSVIFGNAFRVVPKHIWEKVDPLTFENYPPVTIGPYKLKDLGSQWLLVSVGDPRRPSS